MCGTRPPFGAERDRTSIALAAALLSVSTETAPLPSGLIGTRANGRRSPQLGELPSNLSSHP